MNVKIFGNHIVKIAKKLNGNIYSLRIFSSDFNFIRRLKEEGSEWIKYIHFYVPEAIIKTISDNELDNLGLKKISVVKDCFDHDFLYILDNCSTVNTISSVPLFVIDNDEKIIEKLKKNNKKPNIFYGEKEDNIYNFLRKLDHSNQILFSNLVDGEKDDIFESIKDYIFSNNNIDNGVIYFPYTNYDSDEAVYKGEKVDYNNKIFLKIYNNFERRLDYLKNHKIIMIGGFASGTDVVARRMIAEIAKDNPEIIRINQYNNAKALDDLIYHTDKPKEYGTSKIYRNIFDSKIFIRNNNGFYFDNNTDDAANIETIKQEAFKRSSFSEDNLKKLEQIFANIDSTPPELYKESNVNNIKGNYYILTTNYDSFDKLIIGIEKMPASESKSNIIQYLKEHINDSGFYSLSNNFNLEYYIEALETIIDKSIVLNNEVLHKFCYGYKLTRQENNKLNLDANNEKETLLYSSAQVAQVAQINSEEINLVFRSSLWYHQVKYFQAKSILVKIDRNYIKKETEKLINDSKRVYTSINE